MESTPLKFADDTKLGGKVNPPAGRDHIQADLDRLEKWTGLNRMRFKDKCRVLHLGRGNQHYGYKLGADPLGSTEAERDLGVRTDSRMNMSRQRDEAIGRADRTLSCSNSGITDRAREVLLLLVRRRSGRGWGPVSTTGHRTSGGRGEPGEGTHEATRMVGASVASAMRRG